MCYELDPKTDLTIDGLRKYDCLCSGSPEHPECKKKGLIF